jgi:hypothetical protein
MKRKAPSSKSLIAAFRKKLRQRLAERELPSWKPLRFEFDGAGWTIWQERIEQPDFVKALLPDLPTGEFLVARYEREKLRGEISPELFATVNVLFEHLLIQSEVAFVAVGVAEAELSRATTGKFSGEKSGKVRREKIAPRDAEMARLADTLDREQLADRFGLRPETIRKKPRPKKI